MQPDTTVILQISQLHNIAVRKHASQRCLVRSSSI